MFESPRAGYCPFHNRVEVSTLRLGIFFCGIIRCFFRSLGFSHFANNFSDALSSFSSRLRRPEPVHDRNQMITDKLRMFVFDEGNGLSKSLYA